MSPWQLTRTARRLSVAPRPETPEAEPSEPIDLSGITLTDPSGGAGFVASAGDGTTRVAALRTRSTAVSTASRSVATAARPALEAPVADLSQKPKPPLLAGVLEANYPSTQRQLGIEGDASVRAQIDSEGKVRAASVVHESDTGFGAACRKTLLGSIWSPALDRQSRRVATAIIYRCRFRIER